MYPADSGTLEYYQTATITSEVSGTISSLNMEDCARVSAGAVLAAIDNDDYETQIESLEKKIESANASLAELQETLENCSAMADVTGTYLPVNDVSDDLVGLFGTLVLNFAGKSLTFLPEDSGMSVSAYYTDGGTVKYVLVTTVDSTYDSVTVITGSYALSYYTAIYKNGSAITSSGLEKYDVLTYDSGSGVYYASDTRVTGIWEDAEPNDETPSTITVLGAEFDVLESAASSLSDFEIWDSFTLLLTVDNKVAYAVRPSSLSAVNIGYVANATSGGATIELLSGITVSGRLERDDADYEGLLVRVTSSEAGYVTLSELSDLPVTSALDLTDDTLGDYGLAGDVRIFECVGSSEATEIKLGDILVDSVSASSIRYYTADSSGNVNFLLLDNVTGDVFTYGFLEIGTSTSKSGSLTVTNNALTVRNSNGTTDTVIGYKGLANDAVVGIASTSSGTLTGYATLTRVTGVSRYDFEKDADGNLYVLVGDDLIPIWDDVQVYYNKTDTWVTLEKARAYSNNLTVYYDKNLDTGAKVRVMIAY